MSEHPSNGSRALLPGQVKSWLGIVAFVLVAVAVLAFAFVAIRPATNTDLDRRTAQKALRADTESKAKALLTDAAKNADGSYRLPVADAMAVIAANPKVLADMRKSAAAPAPAHAPSKQASGRRVSSRGAPAPQAQRARAHNSSGGGGKRGGGDAPGEAAGLQLQHRRPQRRLQQQHVR
ncbi:MAG: hypothetical protein RL309_1256, partial [Verrucomicrobiota bacterium]